MKKLLLLLVLLPAIASAEELTEYEACERISYIVRDLMQDRQNNVPLSKATKIAAVKLHEFWEDYLGDPQPMEHATETAMELANSIYDKPIEHADWAIERAIVEAENKAFAECMDASSD